MGRDRRTPRIVSAEIVKLGRRTLARVFKTSVREEVEEER